MRLFPFLDPQPATSGRIPGSFGVVRIQTLGIFPSWFRVMGVPSPALLRSWLCPSPVMIHTRQRQHPRSLQASAFYSPFRRPERSRSGSRTPPPTATRFKALWATGFQHHRPPPTVRPFLSLRGTTPDSVPQKSFAEPVGPANPGSRATSKLQPELRGGRPRSFDGTATALDSCVRLYMILSI